MVSSAKLSNIADTPIDGRFHRGGGLRTVGSCLFFEAPSGDWGRFPFGIQGTGSLILAKRCHRHATSVLFRSKKGAKLAGATILDPLVLALPESPSPLRKKYIAGLASHFFPATHLTPYRGIRLRPSILITYSYAGQGSTASAKYWDFRCKQTGSAYASDVEYEEHFRAVFPRIREAPLAFRTAPFSLSSAEGWIPILPSYAWRTILLARGLGGNTEARPRSPTTIAQNPI